MKKSRRWLMILLAAGLVGLGASSGTFATFNATTTNGGNTFATGNLLLSNQVNSGTVCFSYSPDGVNSNANTGCDKVINLSSGEPGSFAVATVTVGNTGTLNGGTLTLTSSGCTDGNNANASENGTGSLCDELDAFVNEVGQGTVTQDNNATYTQSTTNTDCWIGGACPTIGTLQTEIPSGTALSTGALSLNSPGLTSIGTGDLLALTNPQTGASQELTASATDVGTATSVNVQNATAYSDFPAGSDVIDLNDAPTQTLSTFPASTPLPLTSGGPALAAGAARQFEVGVYLPFGADNTFQGRSATFDLTWTLTQQ